MKPDRLKMPVLEELRDHYDGSQLGLILIGMPGIEKRLARYPQLYSRVGLVDFYPTALNRGTGVRPGQALAPPRHGRPDNFTTAEALAAITRITGGNFRLISRLAADRTHPEDQPDDHHHQGSRRHRPANPSSSGIL